jgi:hypothetical protein
MKPNFSLSLCYFLYLGIAIFLNPARNASNILLSRSNIEVAAKMENPVELEATGILHGEFLFRY